MAKEASFENALAFAQDLIRIPSLSGHEGDVAKRVVQEMEVLGFRDIRMDDLGNAIGVIPGTGAAPSCMLNCHMDVVAEGDHDDWEFPPFDATVDGGFLHGRGSMDIKGPLALQTYAAAALAGRAPGDVIVAHTVFEERGGWGMEYLLESKGVEPGAVIIGEATKGDITTGHRGRAEVEINLKGLAGHASAPERARNALDLVPAVLAGLADLASNQPEDPVLGRASLVPTNVDVLPESRNVVPDDVTIVVDWRILPTSTNEELLAQVRAAIEPHLGALPEGMAVEVRMALEHQEAFTGIGETRDLFTPGFLMEGDHPMIVAAAKAVGNRDGSAPAAIRPWTFATDGGWSAGVFGIPTLGFAPGEERYAHTNTERLDLDEAEWAYSRHGDLIMAVQKALI
ncbi:MAG: M20/M25/M40 family metallo-hydrolase [Gemmatimonadetes bacterium]|nr:M20/M25/M40 family metallo-hydrolase [Gemmatimonadota bacterium]